MDSLNSKKVAVMQPYIFPYVGYFQLINAVNVFVIYDDVNFIKRGWINRNKILVNGKATLITFPCIKISQNKLIKETEINLNDKAYSKILKTISESYNKAPYYDKVFPLIEEIFDSEADNIADLASNSIIHFSKYLNISTEFLFSSKSHSESKGLRRADRLIEITSTEGANNYVNAIGGQELYNKEYFQSKGVKLEFLKPSIREYTQFAGNFIPGLSIIDVAMFNSPLKIKEFLNNYKLV